MTTQLLVDALRVMLRDYEITYGIGDMEMQPALYQANAALAVHEAKKDSPEPSAECWRKAVQEFREWGHVDDANAIQQRATELAKQP